MANTLWAERRTANAVGTDPTMVDDDDPMFGDDPEVPDELNEDRCPDCGAYPEDYHEMDCAYADEDDDIEDDEDEDVEDYA